MHLQPETRRWWRAVVAEYFLEEHHVRLLTLAAEAWDLSVAAREALAVEGITYTDRFGQPRARPEVAVARDARLAFARFLRELDLDVEPPPETTRPPALPANRRD